MNLPVTQKFSALQARNHAKYPRLLGKTHVILEADQVVAVRPQVFLPQLHYRIRTTAGARIDQPHRFHRTEAQRLAPAPRQFFDGQAGFEEARVVFRDVRRNRLGRENRVHESLILLAIERTIQIIVGPVERLAIARRAERDRKIDRIRFDDRADRVVEEQPLGAGQPADLFSQRAAGERPGRDQS